MVEETDWRVTKSAIARGTYEITSDRYNEIAAYIAPWCSDWMVHIEEKGWPIEDFIEALQRGMKEAGVRPLFDWDKSVAYVRALRAKHNEYEEVRRELFPRTEAIAATMFRDLCAQEAAIHGEIKRRRTVPYAPRSTNEF